MGGCNEAIGAIVLFEVSRCGGIERESRTWNAYEKF